jgi:predicted nuclease of predicted toxin-antitoxin system
MRFIIDESAGIAVVQYLRGAGHDVLAVAEATPQIDDSIILAQAVNETRILVTNDKDFGELVYRSRQPHCGIVLFRLQDESAANRVHVMAALLSQYEARLPAHFTVVTEASVRIRPAAIP